MTRPLRFPLAAHVIVALVSTTLTVVALDVGLRLTALVAPRRGVMEPVPARHTLTSWIDVFPPGYSGVLTGPDFRVQVHAGSLGLRERDLDIPTVAASHPIVFLGDSYFFGWGVEQAERLTERLAGRLTDKGRSIPIVNLSFPGWGTFHYIEAWKAIVTRLQPRLVVISTFIGNDFTDDLKQVGRRPDATTTASGGEAPLGPFVRAKLAARETLSTSPVVGLLNRALWSSPAFRRLFNGLEVRNDRIALYESTPSELQRQLYAATGAGMEAIARLSQADSAPVLAVIIPDHLQVLMPVLFEGYSLDQPQHRLDAMIRSHGIDTLDLLPAFQALHAPDDMFFREDKHWNARGHALVADILYRRLSDRLELIHDQPGSTGP